MKLSVDFAFEGFRIIRQNPIVILVWGVISLIGNGIGIYALTAMAGPELQQLQAMKGGANAATDPQVVFSLLGKILQAYSVLIPIVVVTSAIVICAVYRSVFDSRKGGFAFLALGMDELRQILLGIVMVFVFLGVYIVTGLIASIVGGLIFLVLTMVAKPLAFIGIVVGVVVFIWFFSWALIRLSLNSVQSFAEKKFNLFGSVALTQGHSLTLFIGYVVMGLMAILVYCLCLLIYAAIAAGVSHGQLSALAPLMQSGGSMAALDGFKNPVVLAYYLVMYLLVTPLMMALSYGAPAAAYRVLAGVTTKGAEAVF
jgi:hypothetical protein